MDIHAEKIDLAKRLLETEDEAVLLQIKEIFESHSVDFLSDLPNHVKAGIARGRQQAVEG